MKMRNKLIGGVTPFKKRTSTTKAGDVGIKATATKAQDKSGYSRSGAEGVNTPSFTPNTRVTDSLVKELDIPKAAADGKDGKSGKTVIGTDASGAPIYNYYGDTNIDQSATYTDSFNQTANVNQENLAAGGGTGKSKKKYKTEDQVCHADYLAKHGKGGPGSPECLKYKEHRKNNPRKNSTKIINKNESKIIFKGHKIEHKPKT